MFRWSRGKGRTFLRHIAVAALLVTSTAFGESVDVTVPSTVTFSVTDVGSSTPTSTTRVEFGSAALDTGKALRISVKADASAFTPPGGSSVDAAKVSWTTGSTSGGNGSGGTLSSASYAQVFQSGVDPSSGYVDITWSLAAPGSGIRAGDHTLSLRWQFESVTSP